MNRTLIDTQTLMSVGSLLTDTQGHLIFTEANRQQGPQLATSSQKDRREVGDKNKREAKKERKAL